MPLDSHPKHGLAMSAFSLFFLHLKPLIYIVLFYLLFLTANMLVYWQNELCQVENKHRYEKRKKTKPALHNGTGILRPQMEAAFLMFCRMKLPEILAQSPAMLASLLARINDRRRQWQLN